MSDALISNYLQFSGYIVLYWDHLLTLPEEILYLWRRPISLGAGLFFVNRYLPCVANVLVCYYLFFEGDSTRCDTIVKFHEILLILSQGIVAVILTSRVYAIWYCDRRILVVFCTLWASGAGIVAWSMATSSELGENSNGICLQPDVSKKEAVRYATDWEYMFVFDFVVFALTMVKSYRGIDDTRGLGLRADMPLVYVMMRDVPANRTGTSAITLANAANVGTFYINSSPLRGSLSTIASSISVTLASRIMLNVHKSLARLTTASIDGDLLPSNMRFQTAILDDHQRENGQWSPS
ncbi:hypothetical protein DL96DRAFT_1686398 [Flagelloscypha sp. PMI_526]|nr:hypothetical protein DL96DRAFT_1686398 [Flagelloscypha sp. PMI_526]